MRITAQKRKRLDFLRDQIKIRMIKAGYHNPATFAKKTGITPALLYRCINFSEQDSVPLGWSDTVFRILEEKLGIEILPTLIKMELRRKTDER